jgi:hypothetical protein
MLATFTSDLLAAEAALVVVFFFFLTFFLVTPFFEVAPLAPTVSLQRGNNCWRDFFTVALTVEQRNYKLFETVPVRFALIKTNEQIMQVS